MDDKIAKYMEIERRGLLDRLSPEKQAIWAEYKSRHPEIAPQDTNVNVGDAIEDIRSERIKESNLEKGLDYAKGFVSNLEKGASFGFGRKLGGLVNAIGSYPIDQMERLFGNDYKTFSDRYHEIVDSAVDSADKFASENPKTALTAQLAGGVVNPINLGGAKYINKGVGLLGKAQRAASVGGGVGAIAGVGETEDVRDLPANITTGATFGAALGGALPVAEQTVVKPVAGFVKSLLPNEFIATDLIKNKLKGIGNVVKDNKSMRVLERGIGASDEVAESVLNKTTSLKDELNAKMANILDKNTGRKLNIEKSNKNQQQRMNDFIGRNSDYELLDYTPNLKKTTDNVSISGRVQGTTDTGYVSTPQEYANSIANQGIVVNKNLPKLSDYTYGLDEFQVEKLKTALNTGAKMSTNAKGTLGATHRAQEVLNDMIDASYDTSVIGQKKPTTETRELMKVKGRLNQILEPSGIKTFDASLSKAKGLQENFEKGFKFNPSETKFENLNLNTLRDKRAFLQGRIAKILDNVTEAGSVASAIKKDQNTLAKLMPKKQFNELMEEASKLETQFNRVNKLEKLAEAKLVRPEAYDRTLEELGDAQSLGVGVLLRLAQKAKTEAMGEANRKASQFLLGDSNRIDPTRYEKAYNTLKGLLNKANIEDISSLTPYLTQTLTGG